MLNFSNTNKIFSVLLIIAFGSDLYYGISAYAYLVLYLLYSVIFFYGVFNIEANFFTESICAKATTDKVCALSFDDGPSDYTLEILQILKEQQIKAAFFCIGKNILAREGVFQQIHRQGHLIGNHSYCHHLLFDFFFSKPMLKDLKCMDAVVQNLIGLQPRLFRPPFGVTNPWLNKAIRLGNYISVGWSARSLDTMISDEEKLLKRAMNSLKPGAVYLFHDTNKTTLAILPGFIKQVIANDYKIVRLDDMLNLPAYK
ncbi:MAG: polysaccharide deacetylase family protein [Methylococcaceae bacterium]|nr:polysaccharide deacetylase family protein [Methylococcaceae bacterium]